MKIKNHTNAINLILSNHNIKFEKITTFKKGMFIVSFDDNKGFRNGYAANATNTYLNNLGKITKVTDKKISINNGNLILKSHTFYTCTKLGFETFKREWEALENLGF